MQPKPTQIPGWVKTWMGWPRWAQILSLVGILCLFTAAWMFANGGSNNPQNPTDPFNDPALLAASVFLKLLVVVVLMVAAFWILRRIQGSAWKGAERQVQVLETTHLTPRRTIHLIQIGDRKLLIGATDQTISLLTELECEPDGQLEPAMATSASFADVLSTSSHTTKATEQL